MPTIIEDLQDAQNKIGDQTLANAERKLKDAQKAAALEAVGDENSSQADNEKKLRGTIRNFEASFLPKTETSLSAAEKVIAQANLRRSKKQLGPSMPSPDRSFSQLVSAQAETSQSSSLRLQGCQ
jgi:uncharacterized protein with von Willebrand factor type A (vWA) domain